MTDKITRIGNLTIDRTHDCPYPGWPNADYTAATRPCPNCGRNRIVMIDTEAGKMLRPPVASWAWRCFGCDTIEQGGAWHPRTAEEHHYSRWVAAQQEEILDVGSAGSGAAGAAEADPVAEVRDVQRVGGAAGEDSEGG